MIASTPQLTASRRAAEVVRGASIEGPGHRQIARARASRRRSGNGRTLIRLGTRRGEPAEEFYKSLGYKEIGVIPGWMIDRAGGRYDHVELYQDLARDTGDKD